MKSKYMLWFNASNAYEAEPNDTAKDATFHMGFDMDDAGMKFADMFRDLAEKAKDTSKINQTTYSFDRCYRLNTLKWNNWKASLKLSQTALTQESTKDIVSKLATIDNSQTLTLGSTLLSYLSEEEIAAATSKGWTLA